MLLDPIKIREIRGFLMIFNILKYSVGNARKIILSKNLTNYKRFLDAFFNSFILESSAYN